MCSNKPTRIWAAVCGMPSHFDDMGSCLDGFYEHIFCILVSTRFCPKLQNRATKFHHKEAWSCRHRRYPADCNQDSKAVTQSL